MIGAATEEDLPPIKREALVTAASILLDQLFDDLAHMAGNGDVARTNVIQYLPPAFAPRYTAGFARQFLACVSAVTTKLVQPGSWPLACVGEELALHALVDQAVAVLEAAGEDADLEDFREAATEDLDCLLIFEPRFDGVEDSPAAGWLGMSNLRFEDWFKPFRATVPVHPYLIP
jgi:hypothetical protein